MLGFSFSKTKNKVNSSKNIAKNRLKALLTNDRTACSTQILDMLRLDIASIIESYVSINPDELTLKISRTDDNAAPILIVAVPLIEKR
jgi:cell division topological specificity factor